MLHHSLSMLPRSLFPSSDNLQSTTRHNLFLHLLAINTHLLVPQRGKDDHQHYDELHRSDLVKESGAGVVLEGLDAPLQVVGDLRQLLHGSDALHEYSVLEKVKVVGVIASDRKWLSDSPC